MDGDPPIRVCNLCTTALDCRRFIGPWQNSVCLWEDCQTKTLRPPIYCWSHLLAGLGHAPEAFGALPWNAAALPNGLTDEAMCAGRLLRDRLFLSLNSGGPSHIPTKFELFGRAC